MLEESLQKEPKVPLRRPDESPGQRRVRLTTCVRGGTRGET